MSQNEINLNHQYKIYGRARVLLRDGDVWGLKKVKKMMQEHPELKGFKSGGGLSVLDHFFMAYRGGCEEELEFLKEYLNWDEKAWYITGVGLGSGGRWLGWMPFKKMNGEKRRAGREVQGFLGAMKEVLDRDFKIEGLESEDVLGWLNAMPLELKLEEGRWVRDQWTARMKWSKDHEKVLSQWIEESWKQRAGIKNLGWLRVIEPWLSIRDAENLVKKLNSRVRDRNSTPDEETELQNLRSQWEKRVLQEAMNKSLGEKEISNVEIEGREIKEDWEVRKVLRI